MFTFPQDDLDDLQKLSKLIGSFWTDAFTKPEQVADVLRSIRLSERQLASQVQELVATTGRVNCPIYHTRDWYPLKILQSAAKPGNPVLYGDGSIYGSQSITGNILLYGGGHDATVAFDLPSIVRDVSVVTNAITNPSQTYHAGDSFKLNLDLSQIVFLTSPFDDPAMTPELITDASGTTVDQSLTLWLYKARLDWQYLYEQFGYLIGVAAPSSIRYRQMINAVLDAISVGTTLDAVSRVMEAVAGVPNVESDGETVEMVESDAYGVLVATDRQAYAFVPGSEPVVAVGDILNQGDPLVNSVRIVEAGNGAVPDFVTQISLGRGMLPASIGELVFTDAITSLEVETDVDGFTKVSWALGGEAADVTEFFDEMHSRGVAAGVTLANYLDMRTVKIGQPNEASLPSTINPLRFLVENALRNNTLFISLRPALFGDDALGTSMLGLLRMVLPPEVTALIFVSVEPDEESITMDDASMHSEDYSFFTP